jgi:two-component system, sensor histidine kinase PdtaS
MEVLEQRLPERLQRSIDPVLTEVMVGIVAAIMAVAVRLPLHPILDERAPYVFIFVAIVAATLLAGWRSGLVAFISGQALTWFFVIEPHWSLSATDKARTAGFVVGTISQLIVLAVVATYQRAADRAAAEREQRMQLLGQALREIDHRTKNNYQTVLAMIRLQAREVQDQEGKEALERTAERIQSVALVSQQLAYSSKDLKAIRLDNHLREMCSHLARGLSRGGLQVECEVEQVTVQASKAIGISIIVNELITNALQHAFPGRRDGAISVKSFLSGGGTLELIVQDNGCGLRSNPPRVRTKPRGLGTKLIDSFVHQLNASHNVVSSATGTKHRILVPQIA